MKTLNTVLKTLLLAVITLFLFSCSKDDNPEQNIRVKTYGVDANEYNLTYNNDGQLTGYENSSGNNSIVYNANNQIIQNGTTTYTYNAQGRMATITRPNVSSNIIYNNASLIAEINSTYTYNSGASETSQTTIDYDSTNKIEKVIEYNSSISPAYTKTEFVYDGNDNLAQENVSFSTDGVSYSNNRTISYTYDNKLNPYYNILTKTGITSNINVIYIINAIFLGNYAGYQGLSYHSKNNVLTSTTIITTATSTEQYSYSYNDANYPIAAERTINNSSGTSETVYYYWTYEIF